jgi:hypothetical protein
MEYLPKTPSIKGTSLFLITSPLIRIPQTPNMLSRKGPSQISQTISQRKSQLIFQKKASNKAESNQLNSPSNYQQNNSNPQEFKTSKILSKKKHSSFVRNKYQQ